MLGAMLGTVAEVIRRAEDEVFALLKANWPTVLRVVNALCKQDRITSIEFDALMAGPKSAGKHRRLGELWRQSSIAMGDIIR